MKATIAVLPGDGIGPEVAAHATKLLEVVAQRNGHDFTFAEGLIGGIAIDECGDPLPQETVAICENADAILLGAVGGPKWSDPTATVPARARLAWIAAALWLVRQFAPCQDLSGFARRMRPCAPSCCKMSIFCSSASWSAASILASAAEQGESDVAYDTMTYTSAQVEQVAAVAYRAAQGRRGKLCSVDKANVLASMRLWRRTVVALHEEYADVALEHLLVDAATMHLLTRPGSFDVIVAGNMFGDILSDEASVLAGSLGMLPSASLRADSFGLYEPVHGSRAGYRRAGQSQPHRHVSQRGAAAALQSGLGRRGARHRNRD